MKLLLRRVHFLVEGGANVKPWSTLRATYVHEHQNNKMQGSVLHTCSNIVSGVCVTSIFDCCLNLLSHAYQPSSPTCGLLQDRCVHTNRDIYQGSFSRLVVLNKHNVLVHPLTFFPLPKPSACRVAACAIATSTLCSASPIRSLACSARDQERKRQQLAKIGSIAVHVTRREKDSR